MRYCAWRTDRVNEQILINEGVLRRSNEQTDDQNFSTETYLYKGGEYQAQNPNRTGLKDLTPNPVYGREGRPARIEDGILLPKYRLPTEAEWEYAAYAEVGQRVYNRTIDRNKYSWNGSSMRNRNKRNQGDMLANYKRSDGDNMGIGGYLNDQANITMQVRFYPPNDFGLYDMAGNVAEWVLDVYRPLSGREMSDHRPFRGNEFTEHDDNYDGLGELAVLTEPQMNADSTKILRYPGELPIRAVDAQNNLTRRNYQQSDYRNFEDGDVESSIYYDQGGASEDDDPMYKYAQATLIGNETRVYKGGSWKDRAYWLSPGTRRYLEQDQSTDFIGFRCAMDRVGFQNLDDNRRKEAKKVKQKKFRRYRLD